MDYVFTVLSCKCYFMQNLAGHTDALPEHDWAKAAKVWLIWPATVVLSHLASWNRFSEELSIKSELDCWEQCPPQNLWHCKIPLSWLKNSTLLHDETEGLWTEDNHCSCKRSGDTYRLARMRDWSGVTPRRPCYIQKYVDIICIMCEELQ